MASFYSTTPDHIVRLSHREAVERYARGAALPAESIAGLRREAMTSFPVPGTWSIQQIVCHLMDSDLVASYRMKRIISEDEPRLDAWDESAFTRALHYHEMDPAQVCEVFRLNRQLTASILRRLDERAFDRRGLHPEAGPVTLGRLVRVYVHHLDHHLRFLRDKRRMVEGKAAAATGTGRS
jgi:hypothetical protein